MTRITVWTGGEPPEAFISLEHTPLILSDLRKALPELKAALVANKSPVAYIDIENRRPRRRNPFDGSQIVQAACLALVVGFAHQVGKELGKGLGDEVKKYVRRWLRNYSSRFSLAKKDSKSANRKSNPSHPKNRSKKNESTRRK